MDIMDSADRFWRRVHRNGPVAVAALGPCWIWTGGGASAGYGCWRPARGVSCYAHRFAYMDKVGPIPDGLVIDHLCRTRRCVNPSHMEPVTNKVNTLRGVGASAVNAAKNSCVNGHPLTTEAIYGGPKRKCKRCGQDRDRARRGSVEQRAARSARRRAAYVSQAQTQETTWA